MGKLVSQGYIQSLRLTIYIGVLSVLIASVLVISQLGKNQFSNSQTGNPEASEPPPTIEPTEKPSATPSVSPITQSQTQNRTLTVPDSWQSYTDKEAGIAIRYPSDFTAKYNPNRGVGINFSAGSYLIDNSGKHILDFYGFAYDGGSRRNAFYEAVQFDGPEEMSKYTLSTTDVSLNGKSFLKLVTSYYREQDQGSNRVFFLLPIGRTEYYFTYPERLELNKDTYTKILTIIANSTLSGTDVTIQDNKWEFDCFPRPSLDNKGDWWDANVSSDGTLLIIQKTSKVLKHQPIDRTYISLSENHQKIESTWISISNFEISTNPEKKGNHEDAFTIKIPKQNTDSLIQNTDPNIPSIAVYASFNGGIETSEGKFCKAHLQGYFATKP